MFNEKQLPPMAVRTHAHKPTHTTVPPDSARKYTVNQSQTIEDLRCKVWQSKLLEQKTRLVNSMRSIGYHIRPDSMDYSQFKTSDTDTILYLVNGDGQIRSTARIR